MSITHSKTLQQSTLAKNHWYNSILKETTLTSNRRTRNLNWEWDLKYITIHFVFLNYLNAEIITETVMLGEQIRKQNCKSSLPYLQYLHACQIYKFSSLGSVAGEGQLKKVSRKYLTVKVLYCYIYMYILINRPLN